MPLTEADVQARLATAIDPNTGKDLVASKSVRRIAVDGADVAIDIILGYPARSQHALIRKRVAPSSPDADAFARCTVLSIRPYVLCFHVCFLLVRRPGGDRRSLASCCAYPSTRAFSAWFMASNPARVPRSRFFRSSGTRRPANRSP